MKKIIGMIFGLVFFVFTACGGIQDPNAPEEEGGAAGNIDDKPTGDNFEYAHFIQGTYLTNRIEAFPVPVYLAYFTNQEKEEIKAGIDIANAAIGFDVFTVVDLFHAKDRIIYKVNAVDFDGAEPPPAIQRNTVGYTYTVYHHLGNGNYNDVVVSDWAMELSQGHVSADLVAHELGHAMGIREHKLIDYRNDVLRNLEANEIMNAIIPLNPVYDDYDFMMHEQGELLREYLEGLGIDVDEA